MLQPWQTRFQTPTPGLLLDALALPGAGEARALVERFGPASVRWQGVRWRWTLVLPVPSGEICIIPDPGSPRLGVRLATGFLVERPPGSMPKPARDLLCSAVCVGPWTWTEWRLDTTGAAAGVLGALGLGPDA